MYTRYQNLWTAFVANNNIENEHDDVALVRFFKSIQSRYSPNTLWVIYGCLNSRFIDNYGDISIPLRLAKGLYIEHGVSSNVFLTINKLSQQILEKNLFNSL